jgi:hypothetical protein
MIHFVYNIINWLMIINITFSMCENNKKLFRLSKEFISFVMRVEGLEPPRRETPDPKSGASANSAIRAHVFNGETCRIRTYDTLIKSQVLYQLS